MYGLLQATTYWLIHVCCETPETGPADQTKENSQPAWSVAVMPGPSLQWGRPSNWSVHGAVFLALSPQSLCTDTVPRRPILHSTMDVRGSRSRVPEGTTCTHRIPETVASGEVLWWYHTRVRRINLVISERRYFWPMRGHQLVRHQQQLALLH